MTLIDYILDRFYFIGIIKQFLEGFMTLKLASFINVAYKIVSNILCLF